jgi:hypothetical protein
MILEPGSSPPARRCAGRIAQTYLWYRGSASQVQRRGLASDKGRTRGVRPAAYLRYLRCGVSRRR